jgi:WD40-like Beta Propeller Repeat
MVCRITRAVLLAALAVALIAAPAQAAFPGQNGKIAFARFEGPAFNAEIYTMNADGTGQTNVTNNPDADERPAWSPDGTKIAFDRCSPLGVDCDVYTMNADGSGVTRLTNDPADDFFPAWSPDGTKIVFESYRDDPDNAEIYTMNADGTGQTNVTNNPVHDVRPAWSPDGTKIVFESFRDDPSPDIYTMNADGSGVTRLTNNAVYDAEPAWSPDGTKIAFESFRELSIEIYTMNADGSAATRLTNRAEFTADGVPDWQPVGGLDPYPRPGSGTPLRVPLVTAYRPCTNPNARHVAPLDLPSCTPQQQQSSVLTTFGASAYARLATVIGNASTPADEADVAISVLATDVRCAQTNAACPNGAGSDFSGTTLLETTIRLTDRASGFGGVSGTVTDTTLQVPVPCTPTGNTGVGSRCEVNTTADALIPNWAKEEKRTILSTLSIELLDPGPNGTGYGSGCPPTCGDGDEQTFLDEGVFAP